MVSEIQDTPSPPLTESGSAGWGSLILRRQSGGLSPSHYVIQGQLSSASVTLEVRTRQGTMERPLLMCLTLQELWFQLPTLPL